MLRSFAAVIGGFLTMTVLVMLGTFALMAAFVPGGLQAMKAMRDGAAKGAAMPVPSPRYLAMNIALSFVAAIVGGWVTTRIAARAPNGHLVALGALLLIMGVVSAFSPGSEQQPS